MNTILEKNLYYVTPDIERATGLSLDTPHYYIITNKTPYSSELTKQHNNIILIEENKLLSSYELLEHRITQKTIEENANILVFKNTKLIEQICTKYNWHLLNPSADLAKTVEEKISQIRWLENLTTYLPPHTITACEKIVWQDKPFILQFNHAHSGEGTHYIDTSEKLDEIIHRFPKRDARITDFIDGPIFTVNIVVGKDATHIGNISYQITGIKPFTDNTFATVGNDWKLPHKILDSTQIKQIEQIGRGIAEKLQQDGWKGLFGIDVIMDNNTKEIYLIEINARQPASTSFESILQNHILDNTDHITIAQAHIFALLDTSLRDKKIIKINTGAQLILRKTKYIKTLTEPVCHKQPIFNYIYYPQQEIESMILRMQTKDGIMDTYNEFGRIGEIMFDFVMTLAHGNIYNMPRGAGILLQNDRILLIERHKFGQHYFVLPGGTQEENEDIKNTVIREIKEETGYDVKLDNKEAVVFVDDHGRTQHYYFISIIGGIEALGGPENNYNNKHDSYTLVWKSIYEFKKLSIKPKEIKKILLEYFADKNV